MSIASDILRRTPLYALHLELGGKMVPFAGYEMPVQYPAGILKEHLHTREKAGLFDVSHMGQAFLSGDTAALERVTPADVTGLKEGMQRYGLLLTDAGTIKDDFMFSRLAGEADLYLVVNAGTKEGDFAYIAEKLKGAATLTPRPTARCWRSKVPPPPPCWKNCRPAFPNSPSCRCAAPPLPARPPLSAARAIPARMGLRFRWKGPMPRRSPAPC